MHPGIFETVFVRDSLPEVFEAVAAAGCTSVQFHPPSAGLDPWNHVIPDGAAGPILAAASDAGVRIPAVDGTYNMAHPDRTERRNGHEGLRRTIALAAELQAAFVTLCTGTRDTSSMWREHPANSSGSAWQDMVVSVTEALVVAREYGVTLLLEPEPANIVSSSDRARELLDQLADDRLKIVLDPANIVLSDRTRTPLDVLQEAFEMLGSDIALAHAKDLSPNGQFCAAGSGIVPWVEYWTLLDSIGYQGDVIFHTLSEDDVSAALAISPWREVETD